MLSTNYTLSVLNCEVLVFNFKCVGTHDFNCTIQQTMLTSSYQDSSDVQQPAGNKFYFIVPKYIYVYLHQHPQTSSLALGLDSSRLIELFELLLFE